MAVLEVEGYKLDRGKLMKLRVPSDRGEGEQRLILPEANWNTSGQYLLHSLSTGRITPVPSLIELLKRHHLLDDCLSTEA
ncbi:MAG: hypothetical protein IT204_18280 [Fimbriimonadaceae bacterium]|nr:hypothetical protein [Fimbriimonadaceae bacterium]